MQIRLATFATVSDLLGPETHVELPEGARLSDLKARLVAEQPRLEGLWTRLAVAVDHQLVRGDDNPELRDGVEVALLPPVSGGAPADGAGLAVEMPKAGLVDAPIDTASVARYVATPDRGAVLTFHGTVRDNHFDEAGQRQKVLRLSYSAHREMASAALERIVSELEAAGENLAVAIVHRLGEVEAGEASVVIAVASPHREASYDASREALERLKREVPIWKKEHFADGEARWREVEPLRATG